MSYCVDYGKDKVIFLSKEDLDKPSTYVLPELENEEPHGFLLPNGEINWDCPCLGSMVVGPCNIEFRESLTCFHKSTAETKGSDCLEKFHALNECMARYPTLYPKDEEKENVDDLDLEVDPESENNNAPVESPSSTSKEIIDDNEKR